jgi:dipeptidyl aminopeptidase/acylaminoacyl peptidase
MRLGTLGRIVIALLVCWSGTSTDAGAQSLVSLPIEVALAQPYFQSFAPITSSPDGLWVAYTLRYPNRAEESTTDSWFTSTGVASTAVGARVRITELRTGRTVQVGGDSATSWGPAWSPDGRYLAFYSDADGVARLWVREVATGRSRRISDVIVRAHRAIQFPRWTPDSRGVVIPILPYGAPLPEARHSERTGTSIPREDSATVTVLRADPRLPYGGQGVGGKPTDVHESLRADLALVDVGTREVTTLASGYWPLEFAVSPDGRFVIFSSERPPVYRGRWIVPYDLMVVPMRDAMPAPVAIVRGAAIANYARGVYWAPQGATILYSATDSSGHEQYFTADATNWRPRRVAASFTDSIASSARSFWWAENSRAFYILGVHSIATVSMPDGRVRSVMPVPGGDEVLSLVGSQSHESAATRGGESLIAVFREDSTKRMGFARIGLQDGSWRILRKEDRYYGTRRDLPLDVTTDGRLLFRSEDAGHPPDVWIASEDLSSVRHITHVMPETEQILLGTARLINFSTASGVHCKATLLLPAGYGAGKQYPLVVYPYPVDARSNDVNVFGVTGGGVENMQLLATRGFAVLAPDVAPFDWRDQMRALAANILPAVDRVIALGIADSTKLGIMGHSWGGYTTLALIAQTPRFRAAVMRGGMGDEVAMSGALQTSGYAYGMMLQEMMFGGPPWEQSETYHRNSPIYLLDRVRTPLLIIHGEGETTVPLYLAGEVFAGLQRLGREVEFARYEHENHSETQWSYANQRDYLTRMLGWFDSHLRQGRDARGVSAADRP